MLWYSKASGTSLAECLFIFIVKGLESKLQTTSQRKTWRRHSNKAPFPNTGGGQQNGHTSDVKVCVFLHHIKCRIKLLYSK